MAYKYRELPTKKEVFWIKLIKKYDEPRWREYFPRNMEVGDITWCVSGDTFIDDRENLCYLFEDNRHYGNFLSEFFQRIDGPNSAEQYEIY